MRIHMRDACCAADVSKAPWWNVRKRVRALSTPRDASLLWGSPSERPTAGSRLTNIPEDPAGAKPSVASADGLEGEGWRQWSAGGGAGDSSVWETGSAGDAHASRETHPPPAAAPGVSSYFNAQGAREGVTEEEGATCSGGTCAGNGRGGAEPGNGGEAGEDSLLSLAIATMLLAGTAWAIYVILARPPDREASPAPAAVPPPPPRTSSTTSSSTQATAFSSSVRETAPGVVQNGRIGSWVVPEDAEEVGEGHEGIGEWRVQLKTCAALFHLCCSI